MVKKIIVCLLTTALVISLGYNAMVITQPKPQEVIIQLSAPSQEGVYLLHNVSNMENPQEYFDLAFQTLNIQEPQQVDRVFAQGDVDLKTQEAISGVIVNGKSFFFTEEGNFFAYTGQVGEDSKIYQLPDNTAEVLKGYVELINSKA